MSCVDEETDDDRIGRFSWSLACLQDLENANESADQSVVVKPVEEEDDSEKETRRELINPSSTTVSNE